MAGVPVLVNGPFGEQEGCKHSSEADGKANVEVLNLVPAALPHQVEEDFQGVLLRVVAIKEVTGDNV